MNDSPEQVQEIVHYGRIRVPYEWAAGEYADRFLTEIRDNKRILGTKCPKCATVFAPPRRVCPKCFVEIREWVELGDRGTLLTYTIVRYSTPLQPMKAPFAYGLIKLDGADTALVHLLGGVDTEKIEAGMRVQAVFGETREGSILDIKYFRLVE